MQSGCTYNHRENIHYTALRNYLFGFSCRLTFPSVFVVYMTITLLMIGKTSFCRASFGNRFTIQLCVTKDETTLGMLMICTYIRMYNRFQVNGSSMFLHSESCFHGKLVCTNCHVDNEFLGTSVSLVYIVTMETNVCQPT